MPKILLNRARIYYQLDGEGPRTFILFNGSSTTTQIWGEMAEGLAGMGCVIRFDARGFGQSDLPEEPYTLETLAADGLALLDYLEVERAIIIGHAFGGRVAQIFTRDYPERTAALIICGTGGHFPPRLSQVPGSVRDSGSSDRATRERFFLTNYCGSQFLNQQPERARRLLDEVWANRPVPAAIERQLQAAQATPSQSYWGTTPHSIPVLLLYGTEDRFGTAENATDLAGRLKQARLVWIEGAGHMAIREQPERMLKKIAGFIKECGL
jgi:pimeloyl-ACP methyl ester carboxylesterase